METNQRTSETQSGGGIGPKHVYWLAPLHPPQIDGIKSSTLCGEHFRSASDFAKKGERVTCPACADRINKILSAWRQTCLSKNVSSDKKRWWEKLRALLEQDQLGQGTSPLSDGIGDSGWPIRGETK